MKPKPRILTPEGEIIKYLMELKVATPTQILDKADIAKTTLYITLKDLLLANWINGTNGRYYVTNEGVITYWSSVLPSGVDVGRLLRVCGELGVSPSKVVELGVRLVVDVLEAGRVPSDLGYLLAGYDPGLLDDLLSIIRRDEGGTQAQAAEVVE